MSYKQISKDERDRIAILKAKGLSTREIGKQLGRHHSTIANELNRNGSMGRYLPHKAQEKAETRIRQDHKRKRLKTYAIRLAVEEMLFKKWSPELIAGRLKLLHGENVISHEAIYQWIYKEKPCLIYYLAHCHKERKRWHTFKNKRSVRIPDRISIEHRPKIIQTRKEPGHWETDLLESVRRDKNALQVCVERKSRLARLEKIKDKSADTSMYALENILGKYSGSLRQTITYDNGKENAKHTLLNKTLNMKSYFCQPYHSWEKGTVENTNGLIRRFLPKKTILADVAESSIKEIEDWLNNRPKKCLHFKTPKEVFDSFVALAH